MVVAHGAIFISTLLAPASIGSTTPFSSIIAAGLTAAPVLFHLYTHDLMFDVIPLLSTVVLGAIAAHLARSEYINAQQIHQVTYPVATLMTSFLTSFDLLTLLPSIPLYYSIFTIAATPPHHPLYIRLRQHPIMKKILHKEDSRKIFSFLCLNLGFMGVQMGYGIYTNSLGLVSDSIHMLVDCAAIAFGLAASVLADDDDTEEHCHHEDHAHENEHPHPHSHLHTHTHSHSHSHSHRRKGKWAKLEDLAGFANGIFLVFVCLSILSEALARLIWPEEVVEVEQLLIVSILGLAVNLVGVFSFNHGYASPPFLLLLLLLLHTSFLKHG